MSEPTKAQLQTKLAAAEQRLAIVEKQRDSIDPEARAFDRCVDALGKLTVKSRDFRSDPHTDSDAIRRVIEALRARFKLDDLDAQPENSYFEPEIESQDDPRDTVIAQLIDALRKS